MKRVVCLVVAVMLSLFLASCQNKQGDVKVGAIFPLTGNMAPYGLSVKRGIDLAVEEVNAAGGINGRKLEIVYEDSQGDPRTGVSAFNKLQMIDRVPLVFGSLTGVILAIRPEADKNNVVLINSSAISPLINEAAEDFLFNFVVNGESEAIAMAKKFQSEFPNEKLAIFCANTPANIYIANVLEQNLTGLGNTNHFRENYETDATDFRVPLDRIKRNGAKYGYLLAFSNKEFADILRQSRELNLGIQWFATSAVESNETVELAGEAANGVIYSYPKIIDNTLHTKFQTIYGERHNAVADMLAITSYDAVHLISEVMKRYGTTGIEIQRGLRSIDDFYGIFGKFKMFDIGKQYVDRELLWKTIKNDEFKIRSVIENKAVNNAVKDTMANAEIYSDVLKQYITMRADSLHKAIAPNGSLSHDIRIAVTIIFIFSIFFLICIIITKKNVKDTIGHILKYEVNWVIVWSIIFVLGFGIWIFYDGNSNKSVNPFGNSTVFGVLEFITIGLAFLGIYFTYKQFKLKDDQIMSYEDFYEAAIEILESPKCKYLYFSGPTLTPGAYYEYNKVGKYILEGGKYRFLFEDVVKKLGNRDNQKTPLNKRENAVKIILPTEVDKFYENIKKGSDVQQRGEVTIGDIKKINGNMLTDVSRFINIGLNSSERDFVGGYFLSTGNSMLFAIPLNVYDKPIEDEKDDVHNAQNPSILIGIRTKDKFIIEKLDERFRTQWSKFKGDRLLDSAKLVNGYIAQYDKE